MLQNKILQHKYHENMFISFQTMIHSLDVSMNCKRLIFTNQDN